MPDAQDQRDPSKYLSLVQANASDGPRTVLLLCAHAKAFPCPGQSVPFTVRATLPQILKRVEAILYAPTAEEGRQILIDTQQEFAGQVFLEEDEAAAQVSGATGECWPA